MSDQRAGFRPRATPAETNPATLTVILKGYPRLSETFIAQELLALERAGVTLVIVSLRQPTDAATHPIHDEIQAPVIYLPEYLWREPWRVLRAVVAAPMLPGLGAALAAWLRDLRRDPTPNRARRFFQALVLAREFPAGSRRIYAHFMHTPGSVARYTALLCRLPWGFSAHAKDIWTIPDWEKREKLTDCAFAVTCTTANAEHLAELAPLPGRVTRVYHGLDLERFPDPGSGARRGDMPLQLLSVGRAVAKKGYPVLLRGLAALPDEISWRLVHIGGGPQLGELRELAQQLGIGDRIEWRGALPQRQVLQAYRDADLFVLASTVTADGDRDGLPNVLMEAQSQRLCCVATRVSGIPELIRDGDTGFLVEPDRPEELARTIARLARHPEMRLDAASRALTRLHAEFSQDREIALLLDRLESM